VSRTLSKNRCARCNARQVLCLCPNSPNLELKTRVTVLIHWREVKKTTNTGVLATAALKNSEMRTRGDARYPLRTDDLVTSEMQPLMLFPTDDAQELNAEFLAQFQKPIHLLVPDGTWSQARKVIIREDALKHILRVKLPPGPKTTYQLRHSPHEQNLSTFEAIFRSLSIIEGPHVREPLEQFFDLMQERTLWGKGRIPTDQCKVPIPEAAIRAFYEDGCAGTPRLSRSRAQG
jgi:DTW domain-containing protein YfiP